MPFSDLICCPRCCCSSFAKSAGCTKVEAVIPVMALSRSVQHNKNGEKHSCAAVADSAAWHVLYILYYTYMLCAVCIIYRICIYILYVYIIYIYTHVYTFGESSKNSVCTAYLSNTDTCMTHMSTMYAVSWKHGRLLGSQSSSPNLLIKPNVFDLEPKKVHYI